MMAELDKYCDKTDFDKTESPDLPKIDSLANLRVLCSNSSEWTSSSKRSYAIYRSSKPDRIVDDDVDEFRKLGLKCIVDFRSLREYKTSGGHQHLDKEYTLFRVKTPSKNYSPGQTVQYERIELENNGNSRGETLAHEGEEEGWKRHYLIDFFPSRFIVSVLFSLPWYLCFLGLCLMAYDVIARNKLKTFIPFFVKNAVNRKGLIGQYTDIVDRSQPSICSALKIISRQENLPALINCAHGKDRTGIVSALILSCLEMPVEYIVKEYSLSTEGLDPIKNLVHKDIVEKYKCSEEFCRAEAQTMEQLLKYIDHKYGSAKKYMKYIGFTEEEQQMLKRNMEVYNKQHFHESIYKDSMLSSNDRESSPRTGETKSNDEYQDKGNTETDEGGKKEQ